MEDGTSLIFSNVPRGIDFEPSLDLIEDPIYLGDLAAATDPMTLSSHGIKRILTIDVQPLPNSINEEYTCAYIFALDRDEADLLSHFDSAIDFINGSDREHKILVHCYFGVSRSATIVCAYLMRKYQISPSEAISRVKAKRTIVQCVFLLLCIYYIEYNLDKTIAKISNIKITKGFMAQLELFFKMRWTLDFENKQFKLYRLTQLAERVLQDNAFESAMDASNINDYIPSEECPLYKCKRCRNALFSENNVFPHAEGILVHWTSPTITNAPCCSKAILLEPLLWMSDAKKSRTGKLHCPTCGTKIGNFDWKGAQCTCGSRIMPCFFIPKNKLDECHPVKLPQPEPISLVKE